jgi:hypothetical protein
MDDGMDGKDRYMHLLKLEKGMISRLRRFMGPDRRVDLSGFEAENAKIYEQQSGLFQKLEAITCAYGNLLNQENTAIGLPLLI